MGNVASVASVRADDGIWLHTELHGATRSNAAHEPLTVVLIHGWTNDRRIWQRQLADLSRRAGAISVLTFDLRGHGRSDAGNRANTTIEQLADDLAAVLRERVPDGRVILVGHSLGGMTVMEYAHRHAEDFAARVSGVVLVSTSAEGSSHTTYGLGPRIAWVIRGLEVGGAGILARTGPWRLHRHVMPMLTPGVRWLVFGAKAENEVIRLAVSMVGATAMCSIGGFRPSVRLHNRVVALAAMRNLPVAVLVGSEDRLTPDRCATTIADALPRAWKVISEGAGHMLPLERPDEVTDAIIQVWRRIVARPPHQREPAEGPLAVDRPPAADRLSGADGPFSADGPLDSDGPLSAAA